MSLFSRSAKPPPPGAIKIGGTHGAAPPRWLVGRRPDHPDIENLYRLEGEGGAEGSPHWSPASKLNQRPPQGRGESLRQLRRPSGDDCFGPREEPCPAPRDKTRAGRAMVRPTAMIKRVNPSSPKQATQDNRFFPVYRHRTGNSEAYLLTVLRPELQQTRSRSRNDFSCAPVENRRPTGNLIWAATNKKVTKKTLKARDPLGKRSGHARLGLGRSRPALQTTTHERLAHLQGVRRHSPPRHPCSE